MQLSSSSRTTLLLLAALTATATSAAVTMKPPFICPAEYPRYGCCEDITPTDDGKTFVGSQVEYPAQCYSRTDNPLCCERYTRARYFGLCITYTDTNYDGEAVKLELETESGTGSEWEWGQEEEVEAEVEVEVEL